MTEARKETDSLGIVSLRVPAVGTYTVCVDESTLPAGATLNPNCKKIQVLTEDTTYVDITLGGNFCSTPPPPGPCWLTGGGTVGKSKGTPDFSFGGAWLDAGSQQVHLIEADVPLVLSSDANIPGDVGALYPQAIDLLRSLGVKQLYSIAGRELTLAG